MTWLKDLKSGDSVFLVTSSRYGSNRLVQVEKVGRKWVTLAGNLGRADINQELRNESAIIDQSFGSPDAIYRNQEAFEARVKARKLRKAVYEAVVVHGSLPDTKIMEIAKLIGIDTNQNGEQ
ncbi:hypothetical protein ACLHDD_02105 [Pantoea sp. NSTU24]|uniref:beta barrel domain-containing protein n=1 Tax=Pantoea sp. NSTU24 TaxID=3391144 RepID=UPI003D07F23F